MNNNIFLLGAKDPEMDIIESILKALNYKYEYAKVNGNRVNPSNAYEADNKFSPKQNIVYIECNIKSFHYKPFLLIDHHNIHDYGFKKNYNEYLEASSIGQFLKIILPQTLRLAIPNLSNVWQITLKDTSLISVTGLVEIMRQSYIAAGSTRDPLFFYSFAAVLYLLLTFLSMKLINKLEVKYSRGY